MTHTAQVEAFIFYLVFKAQTAFDCDPYSNHFPAFSLLNFFSLHRLHTNNSTSFNSITDRDL